MCRLAGTDSCCGCLLRTCFCGRDSKEGGRAGSGFRFGIRDVVRRFFARRCVWCCSRRLFPSGSLLFLFPERAVEVDDENLRIRVQIDILIVRQIADARHVFARFVDVRPAKLFVECGNLVIGMCMVVADFFGRLRQGTVGQTGDCGQFVTVALRTGKADVGMRISGDCL